MRRQCLCNQFHQRFDTLVPVGTHGTVHEVQATAATGRDHRIRAGLLIAGIVAPGDVVDVLIVVHEKKKQTHRGHVTVLK